MTESTAIDKALSAVFDLFKSEQDKSGIKSYIDDSESSLQDLAEALVLSESKVIPVLIGMESKNTKKLYPYSDLLGQLLNGSIHSIVPALLQYLKDNEGSGELRHTVSIERASKRFQARIPDIRESKHLKTAVASLLDWAKLESHLPAPTTPFCRLAGGVKPIVYVFDDYINFIDHKTDTSADPKIYKLPDEIGENALVPKGRLYCKISDTKGELKTELCSTITKFYSDTSSSQTESLIEPLAGFAGCLNNLAVVFDIKAPPMEFEPSEPSKINYYQQVSDILNFPELDKNRNQIAAFIIDLEWLPCPKWIKNTPNAKSKWPKLPNNDQMGYYAVRLLTQRYPEIPCFVFTGMWKLETLQQSLAAGAAWCFQKPTTHHLGNESLSGEILNYINLERHLTEYAKLTYGAYEQLPNPEQLDIFSAPAVIRKIEEKAKIHLSKVEKRENDNKYTGGENFRKLIARQFTADIIQPIKVLDAGRSGAKATFFAKVFNEDINTSTKVPDATRFIKIDSWFTMQSEYLAYQNVIRPKLNNHVAHIIQKPSCTVDDLTPDGIIVSSLAGFPEDFSKLKTLHELIQSSLYNLSLTDITCEKISNTLMLVLLPLYQNPYEKTFWVGETYSPIWEGKIIPLSEVNIDILQGQTESADISSELSLVNNIEGQASKNFHLRGWQTNRIRLTSLDEIEITLSHPQLGRQIKATGEKEDLSRRFYALWIRPGMSIDFIISIESREKVIEDNLQKVNQIIQNFFEANSAEELLTEFCKLTQGNTVKPFEILKECQCKIKGLFGTIHGDLNANNILYPDGENTGFLIDFANTKTEGLIAFDLSSLEERVWRHHLIPRILVTARNLAPSSKDADKTILGILNICLKSCDFQNGGLSLFESKIREIEGCHYASMNLFLPIINAIKIIHTIRRFAFTQIKPAISIDQPQMCYALGTAFLLRVTRTIEHKDYTPEILSQAQVLIYLCASYYLDKVVGNSTLHSGQLLEMSTPQEEKVGN
jgi:hypothetical protein